MDDDEPVGLRDGRLDRGGVERDERARVDDLDAHALRLELARDPEGVRHRWRRARRRSRRCPPATTAPCRARSRIAPPARAPGRRRRAASARGRRPGCRPGSPPRAGPWRRTGSTASRPRAPGCGRRAPPGSASAGRRAARRRPPTMRITSGIVGAPPIMNRSFAAWFMIWSKATPAKSENWSSTTGRSPVSAAPIAAADETALGQRRVADALGAVAARTGPRWRGRGRRCGRRPRRSRSRPGRRRARGRVPRGSRRRTRGAARPARAAAGWRRCGAKTDGSRSSTLASSSASAVVDGRLDLRLDVCADRGDGVVVELAARAEALLEPRQRVLRPPTPRRAAGIADVGQVRPHRVLHAAERLHLEERRPVARAGELRAPPRRHPRPRARSLPSTTSPGIP